MNDSWLDSLSLFQWLSFGFLVAAWPVYEVLKLRRRARIAEERADHHARDYAERVAALDAVQRQALDALLQHPQPLRTPPAGFAPTLGAVRDVHSDDPYAIPIGWQNSDGVADLVTGSLHGDSPYFVGNVQVTGMTRWGKNLWEFLATTTLCHRASPGQLRIFCIDGKGPDGALWRDLAHNWREPVTSEDQIPAAIAALETLRAERMQLLERYQVTKWEELPLAVRPPLVWVVINELSLLERVLGRELERWLTRELASALAGGIRYCILMQDAANWETGWRRQIGLAVAGGQVSRDADKPNLGMATAEIRERGGIPPSELGERGWFTVRFYRDVVSVSIPYLDVAARKGVIAQLPRAAVAPHVSNVPREDERGVVRDTPVPGTAVVPMNAREAALADLLSTGSTHSTRHTDAVSTMREVEHTQAREPTAVPLDELTDEQIKALHRQGWSPTRIAESPGMRGRKQARLERVYAILGIPRRPTDGTVRAP